MASTKRDSRPRTFYNTSPGNSSIPRSSRQGSPSMFPQNLPMGRDASSLEPMVFSFIFIYICHNPRKEPIPRSGEKYTFTVQEDPRERKAYIQRSAAWFPLNYYHSTMQPSARYPPSCLSRTEPH